jgi:hypothetical protein
MTMTAGYICRKCYLNTTIEVRERAPEEGIENYMYHVGRMCGEDHGRRRPHCRAEALDLKLPITKNGVGYAGEPLSEEEKRDLRDQLRR